MSDFATFLTARFDEEQADAEAAHRSDPAPWGVFITEAASAGDHGHEHGAGLVVAANQVALWDCEGSLSLCMTARTTEHVARWDPDRVLKHITAKRELLAEIMSWRHDYVDGDTWFSCAQAVDPFEEDAEPGSGCSNDGRAGEPCDCGLDRRRTSMLKALAKPYTDHPDHPSA